MATKKFENKGEFVRNWLHERGRVGMDRILPGLYVGGLIDVFDAKQISAHSITVIVSVLESEVDGNEVRSAYPDHDHLFIRAVDSSDENIGHHFAQFISFVHNARLAERSVLVHCFMGASRSVAFVAAYLMTATKLTYPAAMSYIESKRPMARPNFGFRMQLCKFGNNNVISERKSLQQIVGNEKFDNQFTKDCVSTCTLFVD